MVGSLLVMLAFAGRCFSPWLAPVSGAISAAWRWTVAGMRNALAASRAAAMAVADRALAALSGLAAASERGARGVLRAVSAVVLWWLEVSRSSAASALPSVS